MVIRGARVYTRNHCFEERDIWIKDRRIAETGVCQTEADTVLDASGLFAIPGLVDLHLHGAAGFDFCTADKAGLQAIADYEASKGVMALCATTMTLPREELEGIIDRIAGFAGKQTRGASLVGIRLEGPFLNEKKTGAQDPAHLCLPDAGVALELLERSGGLVKLLDVAPELEGGMELIGSLQGKVKLSLGHTDADFDAAMNAFKAGAEHLTHLYNAMNGMQHRQPGPIVAGIECGATAEVIADGIHVHPAMVRLAFREFGPERMILISDSMEATGLGDGSYSLGGQEVTVHGRRATLAKDEGTIAGSVTNLYDCMRCVVREMGIPLADAIRAASENPARLLGMESDYGSLEAGRFANICLVDEDLNIKMLFREGERIEGERKDTRQ